MIVQLLCVLLLGKEGHIVLGWQIEYAIVCIILQICKLWDNFAIK